MLELFVSEYCPYCQKVMSFFDENNVIYEKKDVSISENFEKLVNLGGHDQVPFLNDTDNQISMYESNDIIDYVKNLKEQDE